MDCNAFKNHIDGGFTGASAAEVEAHLSACPSCRKAWAVSRKAQEVLRGMPEPRVPVDYAERALAHAWSRHERPAVAARGVWLALAATFVLGLGLGVVLTRGHMDPPAGYTLRDGTVYLQSGDVTTVRIAVDAERDMDDVAFVIGIPAGMELQGHPGEQRVAWQGSLKRGRNLLGLPLQAKPGASGVLQAEVRHGDHDDVFQVHVMTAGGTTWWSLLRQALT